MEMCFFTKEPILSMSRLFTGKMPFNLSSGLMMRPSLSFLALMYFQIAFVTSTLLSFFAPQISAKAELKVFGAKRPIFFAFAALAAFFEPALRLRRTCARFAACALKESPFLVFVVVVVAFFVVAFFEVVAVFVILIRGLKSNAQTSLEPK